MPAKGRAWIKSQFCFHTDSDLLFINGRVVPAARERSNAAEVGWEGFGLLHADLAIARRTIGLQ